MLQYAQRLARFTSAPPGYRPGGDAAHATTHGYDTNAKRAAGYYNPTISTMRQEMPFPSDTLMRQGILYADAAAAGVAPPADATRATDAPDEYAAPSPSSHVLDTFGMHEEEDDAFDFELNP